jgi:hypothetical protein
MNPVAILSSHINKPMKIFHDHGLHPTQAPIHLPSILIHHNMP